MAVNANAESKSLRRVLWNASSWAFRSFSSLRDSWSVSSLSLLVVLAGAGLSEGFHPVDLVLRTDSAEVVHLANGSVHAFVEFLERDAKEALATHDLRFLRRVVLLLVAQRGLPLRNADEHVLFGFIQGEHCSAFTTLNCLHKHLRRGCIEAEDAAKHVLAVEARQHGEVTANADASDEELVSAASHRLDLPFDDLLQVCKALRLQQVLAMVAPTAAPALVVLLDDDGTLNADDIDQFIKAKQFFGRLAEESVDVSLRVLAVVVQEDASGVAWVHQIAIGSGHWLKDDVVADVVLEETVLGHGFSRFFSAHFIYDKDFRSSN